MVSFSVLIKINVYRKLWKYCVTDLIKLLIKPKNVTCVQYILMALQKWNGI